MIWVSGLEELTLPGPQLAVYARAVREATERGQATFALYGGFFHVLLGGFGLGGASHGIGYGEYRSWLELPRSGPPPARYYLRRVHRYVSQELAYQLYLRDRALVECDCLECEGQPPIGLDYHALMKHSVWSRADEVAAWAGLAPREAAERLEGEYRAFATDLDRARLPAFLRPQVSGMWSHVSQWVDAIRSAAR